MEVLAILRLNVSKRRNYDAHVLVEDDEEIALPSPPSSPRHAFTMEVEESPLGEVRAAIPFLWELIPGTPKDDFEWQPVVVEEISNISKATESHDHGSSRSSEDSESLCRDSSNSEFKFCTRFEETEEPLALHPPLMSTADELFSNDQVVPLRLPPRLQSVKNVRNSDSSCNGSFRSCHSPQSPQSPQVLHLGSMRMLCGFMKNSESESEREEVTILGMQEGKEKPSSLSPLRFLNRESSGGSNFASETYFSRDSVSSLSSYSSFSSTSVDSPQALWDSPHEKRNKGHTLNDLVPDIAIASQGIEDLKVSSIKEITQERAELATEQLSPYTRLRPSLWPSTDMHDKFSRKEHLGRSLFANRLGMLRSCLGMPLESP